MFHFSKLENIFFGYWIQNTRFLGCIVLIKLFKKYVVVKSLVETGNNIAMSCLSVSPMHCSVQIQSLHSPFQIYWVKVSQSVVSVYKQQKQHMVYKLKQSLSTTSNMDSQLLRQKSRQKFSLMKTKQKKW